MRAAVRELLARRLGAPDVRQSLTRLSRNGFVPGTIFDVGAHRGDFARLCLDVWPHAKIVAFEVLDDKVAALRAMQRSGLLAGVIPCLLGAATRDGVRFHELETASSVLQEHVHQNAPVTVRPMRTVDDIVESRSAESPDFLKLDVQGYELEVLKGAERTLPNVKAILAELNFIDIHGGVPLATDVMAWLDHRGWVPYDICGLTRRPLDAALWQSDFIFVRRDGNFRSDKRWS